MVDFFLQANPLHNLTDLTTQTNLISLVSSMAAWHESQLPVHDAKN